MPQQTMHLASRPPRAVRTLRGIALFEALKGVLALVAGIGLTQLLHHDLHSLVLRYAEHLGLSAHQPLPALLLQLADQLQDTPWGSVEFLLTGYMALRMTEAYGLWMAKAWAEWLGALSGGLYIPFELRHLWHSPGGWSVAVLVVNVSIVGYLSLQLWQRRAQKLPTAPSSGSGMSEGDTKPLQCRHEPPHHD